MKVNFLSAPFLLYSGNLLPYLYNDKEKLEEFKLLNDRSWGTDILAVSKIIRAVNISPERARPTIEYGALP